MRGPKTGRMAEPNTQFAIGGFVLVGGASSRMGESKPEIELGGMKLFERSVLALGRIGGGDVTLVGEGAERLAAMSGFVLNSISDGKFNGGNGVKAPLLGIHSALVNAKSTWAAVLACDLPFVTMSLIGSLAARVSVNVDAIVPLQADGRPQPLCAIYNAANCIPVIEEMIRSGDMKLQLLLSRLAVDHVPFAEIEMLAGSHEFFLNVNSPGDLERARRAVRTASA